MKINPVLKNESKFDISKYKYRFYTGTEEQEPDSLIQSIEGIGKTPAYRGLGYIVFDYYL